MGENVEKVGKSKVNEGEDVEEEDFTKSVNDTTKSPHMNTNTVKDPYGQSTRSDFNNKSDISTFSNRDNNNTKDKSMYSHKSHCKFTFCLIKFSVRKTARWNSSRQK